MNIVIHGLYSIYRIAIVYDISTNVKVVYHSIQQFIEHMRNTLIKYFKMSVFAQLAKASYTQTVGRGLKPHPDQ